MIDTSAVLLVAAMLCITALAIAAMFHGRARRLIGYTLLEVVGLTVGFVVVSAVCMGVVWIGITGLRAFGWMP